MTHHNITGLGSPVSRYCVERADVPPTPLPSSPSPPSSSAAVPMIISGSSSSSSNGGYATYASCNAPEALLLNSPTHPICICWCAFDRMAVSHEAVAEAKMHCGPTVAEGDFPPCNCTRQQQPPTPTHPPPLTHFGVGYYEDIDGPGGGGGGKALPLVFFATLW